MSDTYVTFDVMDLLVGEKLPGPVFIYIDFRFITFRAEGDVIDRQAFDRLDFRKVKTLFIQEKDRPKFKRWGGARAAEPPIELPAEHKEFGVVREDAKRTLGDIFQSAHPDKIVSQGLTSSKRLVTEVMKFPYTVYPLGQLQTYSKGTVDHSVNVSVLSVYLAIQMGYTHQLILEHVGAGGLLHDIGKPKIRIEDDDSLETIETKMLEHPTLGVQLLNEQQKVPNEVKLIIGQHHEYHDGSGYPKKLRGQNIYDLARIVSIANVFDGLVADGKGPLVERQRHAIHQLDQILYRHFDPQKLNKALKILKMGV